MIYTYENLKKLVNHVNSKIFATADLTSTSSINKASMIYDYLVNNISYDFDLLELRKKKGPVNLKGELIDVLENNKGVCSSISQVYKLLLENIGIEAKAVICNDGNLVLHQLLIVKDKENNSWYFSDITRGIIYKNEGMDNFAYDYSRCEHINQKMLGILPESIYDAVLERSIKRNENFNNLNSNSLFDMPENINCYNKIR